MKKSARYIKGAKGHRLYVRKYEGTASSKGVIQILHGKSEYGGRYDEFAGYLTEHDYTVYVHDHRKHGKSLNEGHEVGKYTDDTWQDMMHDTDIVKRMILEEQGVNSIIMIGHSMGSFLLRTYLMDYGEQVAKAVILGTGAIDLKLAYAGRLLAGILGCLMPERRSRLLEFLAVGSYNKGIEPLRTSHDWLSRDEEKVDAFNTHPDCGRTYTPKFYDEIAKGTIRMANRREVMKTPDIPILFISGDKDPVGNYGKGVVKVRTMYEKLGYDTDLELYQEARHELLHEVNRQDVFDRIRVFLEG